MAREIKQKEPIQQLADSVDLLVRLKIDSLKGDRNKTQMIHLLAGFGLEASEIARLLGLPGTTVAPEVSKLRAAQKNEAPEKRPKKRKA
jgi:DNA-directed RNA polymerase specialized sigma24 family protein